jgi:sugar phosphate isomerase/epimerase
MFIIGTSSEVIKSHEPKKAIELLARTGYQAIELWANASLFSLDPKDVKNHLRNAGLEYRIHADARDINLTSVNKGIREESIYQTLSTIKLASELEAPVVTFHPGRMSSTKDRADEFRAMQIEISGSLTRHAEKYGIILGVENMEKRPKEILTDLPEIKQLFEKIASPHLGLTLDLAHYHSVGDVAGLIRKLDLPIVNVHISQASPSGMHLPLTASADGIIDLAEALSLLDQKYRGPLIIEGYVQAKEVETIESNLKWLRNCLHDLRPETA